MNFSDEQIHARDFIGVVEAHDELQMGRVRVRVFSLMDELEVDDLPYCSPSKSLDGKDFRLPEIGKVVSVRYPDGDIYNGEYFNSEHYNFDLAEKLKSLSKEEYEEFMSLYFDGKLQITKDKNDGFKIDFNYSNFNIDNKGNIKLNLVDNKGKLYLGSPDADQSAMLGDNWMDFFDKVMQNLASTNAYIGNLGAPVAPNPMLVQLLTEYNTKRKTFLSKHVWVVDNDSVKEQKRNPKTEGIVGDKWKSTVKNTPVTLQRVPDREPEPREETGKAEVKDSDIPPNIQKDSSSEQVTTISQKPVTGNKENGKLDTKELTKSVALSKDLTGATVFLVDEASKALDAMIKEYNNAKFDGKQKLIFTDGYRTYERQKALFDRYGKGRASGRYENGVFIATSNHGWATAVDMFWGVMTKMYKEKSGRIHAFSHPTYLWFFENAHKFGWYNPEALRDGAGTDEWWHWEYKGLQGAPTPLVAIYKNATFNNESITAIKSYGGTYV